jgi:hypothetical protein
MSKNSGNRVVNFLFNVLNSKTKAEMDSKTPQTEDNIAVKRAKCEKCMRGTLVQPEQFRCAAFQALEAISFVIGFAAAVTSIFPVVKNLLTISI